MASVWHGLDRRERWQGVGNVVRRKVEPMHRSVEVRRGGDLLGLERGDELSIQLSIQGTRHDVLEMTQQDKNLS
jgi:hypothetical protein